jgi:hypothetical protein
MNANSHGLEKMSKRPTGDPRDPTRVTPYTPKEISQFEDEVDFYPLGAMMVSVMGVMTKSRLWCCVSLVLAVASLATMKRSTTDLKQVFMTIAFTLFALFSTYLTSPEPVVVSE